MQTIRRKYQPAPDCPVDYAFQHVGGKYKGRILWMLKDGIMRYGALRKSVTGITPKMLTQVLRELEDDGLVVRRVYNEVPPRVEYELSAYGSLLLPSIKLMADWGMERMKAAGLSTGHD